VPSSLFGGFSIIVHWVPGRAACFGREGSPDFRLGNLLYVLQGNLLKISDRKCVSPLEASDDRNNVPSRVSRIYRRGVTSGSKIEYFGGDPVYLQDPIYTC